MRSAEEWAAQLVRIFFPHASMPSIEAGLAKELAPTIAEIQAEARAEGRREGLKEATEEANRLARLRHGLAEGKSCVLADNIRALIDNPKPETEDE